MRECILFQWAEKNNMQLHADKFVLLRYGKDLQLKQDTKYVLPGDKELSPSPTARDLGVIMSDDGKFEEHVSNLAKSCRRIMGMVFRTFQTRQPEHLMPLFKSLILSKMDYCSVLWTPKKVGLLRLLENVQAAFTRRLDGMRGVDRPNYWQRLEMLNLFSIERRHERYGIIYVWKALHNLVHNPGIEFFDGGRRGIMCKVPQHTSQLREESFLVWGPQLFNALPASIRMFRAEVDQEDKVTSFKKKLDCFLKGIPDKPNLSQEYSEQICIVDYRGKKSNSLTTVLRHYHCT